MRLAPLVFVVLFPVACTSPNPAAQAQHPPLPSATPNGSISGAPLTTNQTAGACATLTTCTECASQSACRWCTNPRSCTVADAPCTGLLLGHPETCDNDPVERTRLLSERAEARTKGMTAVGPPVVGHLESFPGVDFTLKRGQCYAAVVRFGKGAQLGDVTENERMTTREESASGGSMAQSSAKDAPQGLYCPRSPGTLTVWYQDRWSRARVTTAGQGEVSVQLYSIPISDADLKVGDAKAAALNRKIDTMPADCDDCDYTCRSSGTACKNRCFRDTQSGGRSARDQCEYACDQITRGCQDACAARCR